MALQQEGVNVLSFHGGEPFMETPLSIKEACVNALMENKTRYAPSSGIPELLDLIMEKVRTKNRIPAEPGHAIVVSGGLHGLFGAFLSAVNPGDEVLLLSPYWTPIRDLITVAGGQQVLVNTFQARGEALRPILEQHVTERTRVIYFNSPTNPTGQVYTRAEVETMADFARTHNLAVIADEAYEDILFDGDHISIASLPGMLERTLTVYTLSKSFAMTGWRIGYVIAMEPWMTGLGKITLNSINGVSTPTQWAAVAALQLGPEYFEEIRQGYRQRRDLLIDGLQSAGFECEMPAGTFYAFPQVDKILDGDSWQASNQLLEKARISSVPGVVFGPDGEGRLRLCFSTSIETIEAAVEQLKRLRIEDRG
ncbi:MAG: aminotransferase class I/II-fold pyridoxal phosphate-dependent enzyme [Acidobacteria bacterium]|nr:aminotransferase class I/II-fold pyridoxal phosphate-dependent enzyme [Acidobacteriota bacterium]